jgi:hypothetical protein
MLIVALFSWWYTAGWAQLGRRSVTRVAGVLDFFSVGLLLKSLFAPFRQISVGRVQGSLNTQLHAWGDRQISRAIGAMVRSGVIVFGLIATALMVIVAVALLVLWPLVPFVPLIVTILVVGMHI